MERRKSGRVRCLISSCIRIVHASVLSIYNSDHRLKKRKKQMQNKVKFRVRFNAQQVAENANVRVKALMHNLDLSFTPDMRSDTLSGY